MTRQDLRLGGRSREVVAQPDGRAGRRPADRGPVEAGPPEVGLDQDDAFAVGRRGESKVRSDRALSLPYARARDEHGPRRPLAEEVEIGLQDLETVADTAQKPSV